MDTASPQGRGFANARNAKLHLLAKKKRVQSLEPAASSASLNGSVTSPQPAGALVRLSDVLQANPGHFDSYKVQCNHPQLHSSALLEVHN